MAKILIPSLKAVSNEKVLRRRELPIAGKILVKEGDLVKPDTIVASADLQGELLILRMPEQMGLQVFEALSGLKVKIGDTIKTGDVISEFSGFFGLFKNRFISPDNGTVEFITERTGHLGLRKASVPVTLNAYISGVVSKIHNNSGVSIETHATFVQGIFGLGGERNGKIRIIARANEQLTVSHIPENSSNLILVGGKNPDFATIQKAVSCGAVGLITGSLDDRFIRQYLGYDLGIAITGDEEVPMTVIMTEGFGDLDMSTRVFDLLNLANDKTASINGATQVRAGAVRPEIIVATEGTLQVEAKIQELKEGSIVRLIRVPYFGNLAEVVEIPKAMHKIATGAEARVLKVKLENQEVVFVPRANVELV